jgi:hypothetical protein
LLCLSLLFLEAGCPGAEKIVNKAYRLRVFAPSETEAKHLDQVAQACAQELDSALRRDATQSPETLTFRLARPDKSQSRQDTTTYLDPEQNSSELVHTLLESLLLRELRSLQPKTSPRSESVAWIAAALTYNILHCPRINLIRQLPNYVPVRQLLLAGKPPQLSGLLTHPVSPSFELEYTLYGLHCRLVLSAVTQNSTGTGLSRLAQILALSAADTPIPEALKISLQESLVPNESLQQWYERQAHRISMHSRDPLSVAETESRIDKLKQVPLLRLHGNGQVSRTLTPLEKLPESLKDYPENHRVLPQLIQDFSILGQHAPPLLQEAISSYVSALQKLNQGHRLTYRYQLRKANKQFAAASLRQAELNRYLDQFESQTIPITRLFKTQLQGWQQSQAAQRRLDPALHELLDSLEPK